ncbi:SUN domain-containing ossification factor isoform X2 [Prorops nasuta]|uniref:SUN domain-containing ossification factor isoform X2 n=1 Tax=Prorops nasuta TaxID=863751 RepID=UPI0034CEB8E9
MSRTFLKASYLLDWVDPGEIHIQSKNLLQAVAFYLTIIAVFWCFPTCLYYYRISDTGQTGVLTMVDSAAAELQGLADPKINLEFHSRSASRNSSIVNSGEQSDLIQVHSTIKDEAMESLNESEVVHDDDKGENFVTHKPVSDEAPEVVVVVRAEQKAFSDEVEKPEEAFDTASELNDTSARAQLARDEAATAAVILDGLVTSGAAEPHEDIPSFSEWAQKRLEEAEKKKTHPNVSVQSPVNSGRGLGGMKVRSKNYASPDCGAKIVAANPEAGSAKSVLASTRDEYMLNTCTTRVWFVVELCEAIQAKKIELANFELFSSSPKDFSVYVSDRFPTRDWSPVGHLTAKDERDVQSFPLHPHLFGKFIKVELHSHYGSEHFCPISLFRAYGTSEFEVLETETDTENQTPQETSVTTDDDEDSDEEEPLEIENGEPSRNLFGSARDAVLSIVKKAAEVLVKSNGKNLTDIRRRINGSNSLETSYSGCTTPRYNIHCPNCSDEKFARVYQLISCRDRQLDQLIKTPFVKDILPSICSLENKEPDEGRTKFDFAKDQQISFFKSIFQSEYIFALCNIASPKDNRATLNVSQETPPEFENDTKRESKVEQDKNPSLNIQQSRIEDVSDLKTSSNQRKIQESTEKMEPILETKIETDNKVDNESKVKVIASVIETSTTERSTLQIKPTKTLSKEEVKKESSVPIQEPNKESAEEAIQSETSSATSSPSLSVNTKTPITKVPEEGSHSISTDSTVDATASVLPLAMEIQETSVNVSNPAESMEAETRPKTEIKGKIETKLEDEFRKLKSEAKAEPDKGKQEAVDFALDSLFSDLKDLENDATLQNGHSTSASIAQPTASATPQQKESVFLRLSNRIKALERNMSLSGQYLEELSRRYKKQVEEMQRMLERALTAMGEESRRGDEREGKRNEELTILREEIAILSKSVESLLDDRDSWRSKISAIGQHALLICLEVILVMFILSYCRRTSNLTTQNQSKTTNSSSVRRKSAVNFVSHMKIKKAKNRRPKIFIKVGHNLNITQIHENI